MAGYSQQVKLQFMADTSQPQKQLQQLATQLKQIVEIDDLNFGVNKQIDKAVQSAKVLQKTLDQSMNVDTGKLDLNKFVTQLNKANLTVNQLASNLVQAGPIGERAFRSLATSIAQAEVPMRKMNATLRGMLTSLANTVKWQISSSAIHGMMSGFSSAVGYVKDLNSSLNDIRIVTGKSIDDMARFAEQANKAAKALSTTTKAYTDASLIYYQQGDSQEMAAKKAAITIKAANASFGSSTKEMSEYLTAVWNSYQVGADELERYVDIMAALGAKTATSLEEIATSMQKVAATANTVGVSMEQVSSIISTVSSVTRESAESIGTSYKTIFARMGDLKLGGTDDGIGLGQVSSQLKTIGVQVLDTSGNLRDMGDIITDLGNKWQTMSNAQKTATAQVVAGKRQYTQLMALFENWDMYNKNMSIATNAEGELQQMADVYAESWEAASARVRASWEGVWDSLLNDEALIKMTNSLADVIQGIESVIDGLGGLGGTLATVGTMVQAVFQNKISTSIDNTLNKMGMFFKSFGNAGLQGGAAFKSFFTQSTYQRNMTGMTNQMAKEFEVTNEMLASKMALTNNPIDKQTLAFEQQSNILSMNLLKTKQELVQIEPRLNGAQKETAQRMIQDLEEQIQLVERYSQSRKNAIQDLNTERNAILGNNSAQTYYQRTTGTTTPVTSQQAQAARDAKANLLIANSPLFQGAAANSGFSGIIQHYENLVGETTRFKVAVESTENALIKMKTATGDTAQVFNTSKTAVLELANHYIKLAQSANEAGNPKQAQEFTNTAIRLQQLAGTAQTSAQLVAGAEQVKADAQTRGALASTVAEQAANALSQSLEIESGSLVNLKQKLEEVIRATLGLSNAQKTGEQSTLNWHQKLMSSTKGQKISAAIMGVTAAFSQMSMAASAISNWDESSLTQKVTSIGGTIASLGMQIMSGPYGWVSALISLAGTAIGAVLGEMERQEKELIEKQKIEREKLQKNVEDQQEEQKDKQTLMSQYNDLYETYLRTGEGQDALKASAYELAEAYGILGANLLIAQGNFSAFNAEIIKANNYGTRIANNTSLANKALDSLGGDGSYDISGASTKIKVDSLGDLPDVYYDAISQGQGPRTARQTIGYYDYGEARQETDLDMFIDSGFINRDRYHIGGSFYNYAYSFNQDKMVPWLMSMVGNDEVLAKQLFAELFGTLFTEEATQKLAEKSIENYDWTEILSSSWIAGGKADDIFVDNQRITQKFVSAINNWQNVDSQILDTLYTGSSIATPNFSKHFINKNGSYVLNWNDLTGEEKYTRYWELQAAVGENGEYTQYLRQLESQMKNIADASYGGNADLAAANSQEYKDLQQEYNAVTTMVNTINKVLNNSEISTQVNLIKDLRTLNSQLQLEQTHLQNFLGKNEANSTFSEFTKNYSLMQESIDKAMEDDATAYASLTEFMIKDEDTGKWKVDENKRKEYEAARNALTESFIDTYTGFDDYMLMFQDIAATFDTTKIEFNGEETTVRQRVIDFISQAGIKTIEQFSAELLRAIEFVASSGNYDFENNALIKSVMASDAQRVKYDEASSKYTNFSNVASSFKEDMDLTEAEAFYNAVDWGQDGIISWEEFLEKDYDDRLAYIESISDNYLETVKEEAETLKTTQEATLAQWEAVMNDAKYSKFKGTMGDYVDSSGQYDAVAIRKGFDTYIAGKGYTYNAEKGLYVSNTDANNTKTEQAFWNEYVATDADLAASGISLEALKGYISALEGASGSFVLIQQADGTIAALQLVGDQAESTATAFNRLAKSLSQLPTKQDDLQKIADVLSGGSIATLMNMTASERAQAWASQLEMPTLSSGAYGFESEQAYKDYYGIPENAGTQIPESAWKNVLNPENAENYFQDLDNYNTAMDAILSVQSATPVNNLENITSALDALTDSYEEFITTGKMSDKTKNALQMAGIDPNSIQSIDDYRNAIRQLEADQTTQANSLKTIMTQYGDGLIDWSKMGKDVTWEEFLASQGDNIQVILEKFPKLAEYYEQWRQAAIEADDAGVDLDAIDAQIKLSQAAAASASELEKLKTAAEEAKTAIDQLNGALGKTEPLSMEAQAILKQQGIDISAWGDGTGEGALKVYGSALGKSTMANIAVLQKQLTNTNDRNQILSLSQGESYMRSTYGETAVSDLASWDEDTLNKQLNSMNLSAPVVTKIKEMVEAAKKEGKKLTWTDIMRGLQESDLDLKDQMEQIWAQFEDSGIKAVQSILQAEQTAATETVNIWKTAFQAILAAKQGISEGKSLGESLMGDENQLAAVLAIAHQLGIDPTALLSGGDSTDWQTIQTKLPSFNAATYAASQGDATQFLYGADGQRATSYQDMYYHADTAIREHFTDFMTAATKGWTEEQKADAGLNGMSQEEQIQWLLKSFFPEGYWGSGKEYYDAIGTVEAAEYTAEMKQARTELTAAQTTFNRTYEEETSNINDWKAIHDAAITAKTTGKSIYDVLGKDQAAGIMARLGMTEEQLNAQTVETATAAINASTANISAAQVEFETTSGQIENIELLGTARADALEEVNEQVTTTTNTYGNGAAVRGYNDVWEYLDDHPELTGPEGMAQANAAWKTATRPDPDQGFDSITSSIASMAQTYGMSTDAMEDYIRAVNNITDNNATLTQSHLDIATAAMRQQVGIDMAAESLDGYIRTIKKGDTDSVDYIKSLEGMRSIYKELYNLTDEEAALLSDNFLTNANNMALLQRAMAGDQEAWTQLQGNYNTTHSAQIAAGTLTTQNGALVGDTSAGDNKAFTNQISKLQHEAKLLEQEMEALNSIDITEMPVKGTAAYEALSASLQKAGKSMLEYSRMSQKERAQALGDAKVAKLREQKTKNAELIKAYEDQYDFENATYGWDDAVAAGLINEYQAYLDAKQRELEINQDIVDTQQSTEDKINEIGTADVEARIAALEAEKEQVQETIDAYTELAEIMMQAAETGELTASQIQKIKAVDEGLLTQWNNATTYAQRINIAAKAQATATQKSITALTSESESIAEASRQIYRAAFVTEKGGLGFYEKFDATNLSDRNAFASSLTFLSAEAQKVMLEAYDKVSERMTSESTVKDFIKGMQDELANMTDKSADEIAQLQAELQTTIAQMYAELGEYEVQMAQQAVQTWLDAFNQIAEARKQLLMGEDIGDSLTSSLESYVTLAKAFKQGGGTGSLADAYRSGSLSASQLALDSAGDLTEMLFDSMGMSTDNKGFNLFTDIFGVDGKTITGKNFRDVNARATQFGMKREDFETDEAFEEAVNKRTEAYVQNLLQQSGYDETTARDLTNQALYGSGSGQQAAEAAIEAAALEMHGYAQEYAELLESNTQLAEVEATYKKKVEDLTEQRDEAKLGASATDAIQKTEEGQRTADTVAAALQQAGISPEAYMAMLREKGYDVNTLDDVAKLTDAQLEAVETSLEQDALAAGQAIISAAQIFHAIVTSGGDEAALNAKLEALGVTRDENGNIQGFGNYQGAGLGYGEDSVAGQKAAENVEEATETQNTLQNEYDVNDTEDAETRLANMAARADMTTDEFKTYADTLNSMLSTQDQFNTETAEGREALYQYAAAVGESAKGFEELTAITEDTWKELKDGSKKGSKDWVKNITGLRSSMSKLFNTDMKHITADFVEDHLDELEKMATGTEEEAAAAQEAIQDDLIAAVMKADGLEATTLINAETGEAENALTYLQTKLDQWDGQEIGFTIDANTAGAEANVIASLQSMLDAGTMTASQISAALNAIGWEPEIHWETITLSDDQAASEYATVTDSAGNSHTVKVTEEMASSKTVQIPIIGSAKKISAPGGGARPESSGGGGGGGGKPKEIEKKDPNDEKERYHEINQRLERMDQLLDKVSKHKDRAFGKSYLKNLEQEIKLMKQQEGMYERKLAEAKEWLEYDKGRLAEFGVTFDEFGNISNYDEVIEAAVAEYNAFVERYNAMTAEQQKESDENEEQQEAEEKLENLKEYISDYEDSINNIYDLQNSILDAQNQQSALMLEKIQYKAEYQIEINDDDIELLEYFDKKWEEVLDKQDDRLAGMIEQGAELHDTLSLLAIEQQELDAAYAAGEINLADYVEGLREVKDGIMENLEALQELQETINELYGDTLDMISEKVEEQTGHIDAATEAMGSYITILGLMGRGKNFRELEAFYAKQVEYSLENAKAQRQHLDLLLQEKEYYDAIIASGEELSDTQKIWYQDLLENIDEVNGELLSSTEEVLNNIASEYENVINGIFKELDEVMGGAAGSLAGLADQYSYYTETQERYVTSAKELYEVSKLNRDIENSIEDSTTTASKQMLAALKERINAQSELNELTEYDIEMNRLQYELALAKIGLEEAQNAKDTVRLTRDESGNYVYQYTANDDKINEAEQKYEDVLQQINELAYNRVTELEQMFLDAQQQYYDAAQEIANDTTLTTEERTIKLQELYSRFCETQQYIQEQYQNATGHIMESNTTIAAHYNDTLTAQAMNSRENINETIAGMIEDNEIYKESFREAIAQINEAQDEQKAKMDEVAAATKLDYVAMTAEVGNYDKAVKDAGDTLTEVLGDGSETEGMLKQIHTLGEAWDGFAKTLAETVIPKFETLLQNIVDTIRELANLEDTVNNTDLTPPGTGDTDTGTDPETNNDDGSGSGNETPGSSNTSRYKVVGTYERWTPEGYGTSLMTGTYTGEGWHENESTARAVAQRKAKEKGGSSYTYKNWTETVTKYKTGGLADFTGPAWLDGTKSSPELVLNATDTQNMLTAIGTLRELDTDTIAMLVSTLNAATASLFGALSGNYHAAGVSNTNTQELNQNVEIHADFPNVTDRNEIVEAIDDLVNRAAQFAQKKVW